jgi:dTDP-glucose 4,6-dehydratase
MIYVFGGNGFVGRYLVEELVKDNDVTICDLQDDLVHHDPANVKYKKTDIRQISQLAQLHFQADDLIINLAANQYHQKVPKNRFEYFHSTNVVGTENILSSAYQAGVRKYLMLSTDMIYGKPQYLPVDTNHPKNPFGPYGQSKKECEEICKKYRQKGMNITIFRPRMINGPGRLGILVKLFKLMEKNLPVPIIGNGENHYQMISVFDCVSAILCAIKRGFPNKEYNLGSLNPPNVKTLLKNVITSIHSHSILMCLPGKVTKKILAFLDKLGFSLMYPEQFMIADEEYILDISETIADLEWEPKYNDMDMLLEAYKSYLEQKGE